MGKTSAKAASPIYLSGLHGLQADRRQQRRLLLALAAVGSVYLATRVDEQNADHHEDDERRLLPQPPVALACVQCVAMAWCLPAQFSHMRPHCTASWFSHMPLKDRPSFVFMALGTLMRSSTLVREAKLQGIAEMSVLCVAAKIGTKCPILHAK
jgi:hypothetical protein